MSGTRAFNNSTLFRTAALFVLLLGACLQPAAAPAAGAIRALDNVDTSAAGPLRVLYHRASLNSPVVSEIELQLIEGYAAEHGLTPQWIEVEERWQLLNHLLEDKGDLIASQGQELIAGMAGEATALSPWGVSLQQVVARQDSARIEKLEDLAFRQIALKQSSPVWHVVENMAAVNPGMDIVVIPESMSGQEILRGVSSAKYDLVIMDSLYLKTALPQHPDLATIFELPGEQQKAWIVRTGDEDLSQALSTYLKKYLLALNLSEVSRDDLPGMQERKSIRLITYQSPTNLFYKNGEIVGFEYQLLERFAKQHRMRVDLVLASSHAEMKALLLQGKGDVIAASLPRQSLNKKELAHTVPYLYSAPVVVGRDDGSRIVDIQDLESRRIHLPAESPYRSNLEHLRRWHGIDFQIIDAYDSMNTEMTLFMVSQGMYDLTVVPGHQLKSELSRQIGLHAEFSLSEPESNVWVVRAGDTKLLANLNNFIREEFKKHSYNSLYAQYIKTPRTRSDGARLLTRVNNLSPYDSEIQAAADRHDFDWRLIAAQIYQESQFDPSAVSPVGAQGLMQIMPATAEELGLKAPEDPAQSIKAGVAYLGRLRDSLAGDLLLEDRIWFSLAAYNAGLGRVERVRKYASELGLDPNRWFDNVETAMLKLAQPVKRDGERVVRCRCGETVVYVREIKTLYQNYIKLTEVTQVASADSWRQQGRPDS